MARTASIPRKPPARLKLTMPVPLERDIQSDIRDALARHPAVDRVYRVNSGAHAVPASKGRARRFIRYHDIDGMSDLWVWLKPNYGMRQAFIEVKRPGEGPTDKQVALLTAARQRGHIALCVDRAIDAWVGLTEALK